MTIEIERGVTITRLAVVGKGDLLVEFNLAGGATSLLELIEALDLPADSSRWRTGVTRGGPTIPISAPDPDHATETTDEQPVPEPAAGGVPRPALQPGRTGRPGLPRCRILGFPG
jgi:hypothetical protein